MPSLFGKRKFSRDDDDSCDYAPVKHLKTATATEPSDEVAMSDAVNVVPFPSYSPSMPTSRLSVATNISPGTYASSLPTGSPASAYPTFELYPEVETPMDVDMDGGHHHQHTSSISSVASSTVPGLLQPSANTALRHGDNCTQIPRLRMSSHRGLNGTRTLWSHCESCGAIEMVA